MCTWMNNNYGWKFLMDKRIKWMRNENRWIKKRMKEIYSQQRIMCQSKLYIFTTERYVLIETPPIHLQEVCVNQNIILHLQELYVNQNTTKRYVPIRNRNNMKPHIFYTILNLFLIWIQSFKPFMFRVILAT